MIFQKKPQPKAADSVAEKDKAETRAAKKESFRRLLAEEKKDTERRNEVYRQVNAYEKMHAKEEKVAPEGVFLSAQHINKIYSNRVQAVSDLSLDVKEGEFIVLVGPSGCGKSTTLRMIAGLEDITSGDLYVDGKYANKLEPKDRGVAMVFQSYALYPHMSVYENMAFGLSGLSKEEMDERITNAAKTLQIEDYLKRKPTQLSGGQCQRVALGRAVVRNTKLFLLDEPLSNLDAKLRVQMRSELVRLHASLKNTMIYVTHDQTEAMTMADRIVILNKGRVQQIGTPAEVYDQPANIFVATFMGSPTMNILKADYDNGVITFADGNQIELTSKQVQAHDERYLAWNEELKNQIKNLNAKVSTPLSPSDEPLDYKGRLEEKRKELVEVEAVLSSHKHSLYFGIRPEDMAFTSGREKKGIPTKIVVSELMGAEYSLHFTIDEKDLVARVPAKELFQAGNEGTLSFDMGKIHLFDGVSQHRIF